MNNTPTRTDIPAVTDIAGTEVHQCKPVADTQRIEDLPPAASADIAGGGPGPILQHNETTISDDDGGSNLDAQEAPETLHASDTIDAPAVQDLAPVHTDAIAGGG